MRRRASRPQLKREPLGSSSTPSMAGSDDLSALVKEIFDFVEAAKSRGAEIVAIRGPGEPEAAVLITGYDRVLLAEAANSAARSKDASRRGDSRGEAGATAAAV